MGKEYCMADASAKVPENVEGPYFVDE